jgi:hypothetical protein
MAVTLTTQQRDRPRPLATSHDVLGTALRILALLLLVALLVTVGVALWAMLSLVNAPARLAGGVGAQVGDAAASVGQAVASAQQNLQALSDPAHPPSGLTYDTEYAALQTWRVGDRLPDASQYVLTLQVIKRREPADSPDTALYAVIHAELRQPRETRLLGQLLRSDADPHDHVVYKGESFRVWRVLYRVNWISQTDSALAAGAYRNPDRVGTTLKFEYD